MTPRADDAKYSIAEIDDEDQRRFAIRLHAARGARQRLTELHAERLLSPPTSRKLPPLVRHLPPHNAVVPLPATPKVPRKFQQMRSNADLILVAMLAKYGISEDRLLKHDRADDRANRCRQETAFRLVRFGRHRGLALSAGVVAEMLDRDRSTIMAAARRYAEHRGFDL